MWPDFLGERHRGKLQLSQSDRSRWKISSLLRHRSTFAAHVASSSEPSRLNSIASRISKDLDEALDVYRRVTKVPVSTIIENLVRAWVAQN
jgi:hypothetical protein